MWDNFRGMLYESTSLRDDHIIELFHCHRRS